MTNPWRLAFNTLLVLAIIMFGIQVAVSKKCFCISNFVDFAEKDAEENNPEVKVYLWESGAGTSVIHAFNKANPGKVMVVFFDQNQCYRTYAGRFHHVLVLIEKTVQNVSNAHLTYERNGDQET